MKDFFKGHAKNDTNTPSHCHWREMSHVVPPNCKDIWGMQIQLDILELQGYCDMHQISSN
jgi:hypothetical protein